MKYIAIYISLIALSISHTLAEPIQIYGNYNKAPKSMLVDKQPQGILVDMMNYIGTEKGWNFKINLYPWKRSYSLSLQGHGGIFGLSKTKERMRIFDYSDVMFYDELLLVVMKEKSFAFSELSDIAGRKVGIVRGASFGDDYEKAIKEGHIVPVEVSSPVQRLKMLISGRLDAVLIGPSKVAVELVFAKDPELKNMRNLFYILPNPLKRDPNHLGFAKEMKMKPFLKEFNAELKKGYESGAFEKILKAHSKIK